MLLKRKLLLALCAPVALSFSSCLPSNLPDDLPDLYPCRIRIVQDDRPLENASITLIQTDKAPGESQMWFPMGSTGTDGSAILYSNSRYAGAPLGKFKVLVSKTITGDDRGSGEPPSYALVDPAYSKAETTTFEIEIKKVGKNAFNDFSFDVGKATNVRLP